MGCKRDGKQHLVALVFALRSGSSAILFSALHSVLVNIQDQARQTSGLRLPKDI